MGLFDGFLTHKTMNWPGSSLETMAQLEGLMTASYTIPQLIFKHSTRCSISRFVMKELVFNYSFSEKDFGLWYLDLLAHRPISDAIAQQLEVIHQSPQLLVIKSGKAIAHAAHENVNKLLLTEYIV